MSNVVLDLPTQLKSEDTEFEPNNVFSAMPPVEPQRTGVSHDGADGYEPDSDAATRRQTPSTTELDSPRGDWT
eukprot:337537-Amphidinium_carterae.2